MRVRVLLDGAGRLLAFACPEVTTQRGAPDATIVAPPQGRFHEVELPEEFARIDDANDFHARLVPYVVELAQRA